MPGFFIPSSLTRDIPILLGRYGERVAKTPILLFPPSLGGRTVGLNSLYCSSEKNHISHMCEKSSIPLTASGLRYSGSKITVPFNSFIIPLCLGIPNLSLKSVFMNPIGCIFMVSICFSCFQLLHDKALLFFAVCD